MTGADEEVLALYRSSARETADPKREVAILAAARHPRQARASLPPLAKIAATFLLAFAASALLGRLAPEPTPPLPPTGYGFDEGRSAAFLADIHPVGPNPSGTAEYLLTLHPEPAP
jgi:hypothetical protein